MPGSATHPEHSGALLSIPSLTVRTSPFFIFPTLRCIDITSRYVMVACRTKVASKARDRESTRERKRRRAGTASGKRESPAKSPLLFPPPISARHPPPSLNTRVKCQIVFLLGVSCCCLLEKDCWGEREREQPRLRSPITPRSPRSPLIFYFPPLRSPGVTLPSNLFIRCISRLHLHSPRFYCENMAEKGQDREEIRRGHLAPLFSNVFPSLCPSFKIDALGTKSI